MERMTYDEGTRDDTQWRTTDLEVIRQFPNRFTWGKVIKIHNIGPYTFVEHVDSAGKIHFSVYVDGKSTNTSTYTLDGALIVAIGRKNLECNEGRWMAQAAAKLLGVKE